MTKRQRSTGAADRSTDSVMIYPGARLRLAFVDTTEKDAEAKAKELPSFWVEVTSVDENLLVVNMLVDPNDPIRPVIRTAIGSDGSEGILDIKIRAEYAGGVRGGIQGTNPYHSPTARSRPPEIMHGQPTEIPRHRDIGFRRQGD